ncbi:MAG: GNAT family N-acetyltransferase [bacterium]|nr:GNAT family N-acetyltransferase [bacterium]
MFTFAIDKERLFKHFQKDPVLFAYHIGDLDERYFRHCQFACTYNETAHILESVLIYSGLTTPTVLAFGMTDGFADLLQELMPVLPLRFYSHYQMAYSGQFLHTYNEVDLGLHYKMKLGKFVPAKSQPEAGSIKSLSLADSEAVAAFYQAAYPDGYFEPHMLETGKFVGLVRDGRLVSIAGVHIYSPKYKIAVLGAIATLPEERGHGFATVLTSHLCDQLIKEKLMICLNVKADNQPAIQSYRSLGFEKVHEYQEALFEIRR